jgi:Uma2 family endonuclease
MTTSTPATFMTTEQLLALPDDGRERWLIRGELREKERTFRARSQARVTAKIAYLLSNWDKSAPGRHHDILIDKGIVLARRPDTVVWPDVTVVPSAPDPDDASAVQCRPFLAVQILGSSDTHGEIAERIRACLDAGVKLAWVADPKFRTITVYRPDAEPQLFNVTQTISGEPHLPGFVVAVAEVFAR